MTEKDENLKYFTKQAKVVAIIEHTVRARDKEHAQELFDEGECDEENIIDVEQVIEEYEIE